MPVWLELGLQTIHDRSLDWMNRGHHFDAFLDAVARCRDRGLDVCAHVILGLPGETRDDMLATADALAQLPVQAAKLHNLYVVRGTPLEAMYRRGEVHILSLDEYVPLVCDFLERLPAEMVVHRLCGESPPDWLVAPEWCLDKSILVSRVDEEFDRRDSWQGKHVRSGALGGWPRGRVALPLIWPGNRNAGAGASQPG
jgi:hypothetical protein